MQVAPGGSACCTPQTQSRLRAVNQIGIRQPYGTSRAQPGAGNGDSLPHAACGERRDGADTAIELGTHASVAAHGLQLGTILQHDTRGLSATMR